MGRKIDIIANDGSPLGVTEKSLSGEDGRLGVGGAELALLTLCRAWTMYGNDVTLYNNPNEGGASMFKQKTLAEFNPAEPRDILIIFRSPNERIVNAVGKKVWFSCDQYTIGDFRAYAPRVDKIVCISKFHQNYFNSMYGITNTTVIDLPVRTWEYPSKLAPKVPHRCIFTSIPDRGLVPLQAAWAKINAEIPDASLVITSDWRLWSADADPNLTQAYRLAFARNTQVTYMGAVKRADLIKVQVDAELHLYPCIYDELFCIAVAESQVAGTLPITSMFGSLPTTNMVRPIAGNPHTPEWIDLFVRNAVELMTDPKLKEKQEHTMEVARKRFSVETILPQWEEVFDG